MAWRRVPIWSRLRTRLAVVDDDAVGDGLLDGCNMQLDPEPVDPAIAGGEDLGEVVAGVDLEEAEGDPAPGRRRARRGGA
jgi:hypothetical protein